MSAGNYLVGEWAIYENRGSSRVIGCFEGGVGVDSELSGRVYSIKDGVLFDPDGTKLGTLIELGGSWAVDLGNFKTGHILRKVVRV